MSERTGIFALMALSFNAIVRQLVGKGTEFDTIVDKLALAYGIDRDTTAERFRRLCRKAPYSQWECFDLALHAESKAYDYMTGRENAK